MTSTHDISAQIEHVNTMQFVGSEEDRVRAIDPVIAGLTSAINGLKEPSESKFRIANQKVLLTYRSHLDKSAIEAHFNTLLHGKPMKFFRVAHEKGDNDPVTPYEHSHILIDFGFAFQSTNQRVFDYNDIHPHIKLVTTKTHWNNSLHYIAKEDPANADLIAEKKSFAEIVWNQETVTDALRKYCNKPSDATGIITLFTQKPSNKQVFSWPSGWNKHPWQTTLENMVMGECDKDLYYRIKHRAIIWIYETKGNVGKTRWGQYMSLNKKAHMFANCGQLKDFGTMAANAQKEGWDGKVAIFNLARAQEDSTHYYTMMENLKDGNISVIKYDSKMINLTPWAYTDDNGNIQDWFIGPIIIVFANYPPVISGTLSLDRWLVFKIVEEKILPGQGPGAAAFAGPTGCEVRAGDSSDKADEIPAREGALTLIGPLAISEIVSLRETHEREKNGCAAGQVGQDGPTFSGII